MVNEFERFLRLDPGCVHIPSLMIGLQRTFAGIATMDESRDIARAFAENSQFVFLREGHTSSVWRSGPHAINVSRDMFDASADLRESSNALAGAYARDHCDCKRISRRFSSTGIGDHWVTTMEFIDNSRELTLLDDMKTFAVIEKFNGLGAPTQEVANPVASKMIMDQINAIEDGLGITVSVLQGDVVFVSHATPEFPDGRVVAVACDSPNREVFTPYRHREVVAHGSCRS